MEVLMEKLRMQAPELVEVVEHPLDQRVDGIGRHLGRTDHGGHHPVGGDVVRMARIDATGDGGLAEIHVVRHQLVDRRAGHRHDAGIAAGDRILDVGRRMADQVEESVDLAIAQRSAMFVGLQLGGEPEVAARPAHRLDQLQGRNLGAGAGIADVEALALQVRDLTDAGLVGRHDGDRLGMQREDRAQVGIRPAITELFVP